MEFTEAGAALVASDSSFAKQKSYALASIYRVMGDNYFISWVKNGGNYDYSFENLRTIQLGNAANIIVCDKTLHPIFRDEINDKYSSGNAADEAIFVQGYWYCDTIIIYRR